jgi:hypothetical protein
MKIEIVSLTSQYKYSKKSFDLVYYAVVTQTEKDCPFLEGERV